MAQLRADPAQVEAVAPNFKRRLSGVTATLERVVPYQARALSIAALSPGPLADNVPRLTWIDVRRFWRAPPTQPARIWHARRNIEMLAGVALRDVARMKLLLVFTSASQRHHTGWTRFLIGRMDAVIATSQATASYLKRASVVIRHGIDTELFRPAADRRMARAALGVPDMRLIGCFGRIRAQKGTDVFVDALIRTLPGRPGWGGVVLGRATGKHVAFLNEMRAKVERAGLAGRILFPGEVSTSETPAWYRALDLYVAPQRWEGFGVTPLEAMASGVPVVATQVGAFAELVAEGQTGTMVPPGNVDAMATAIDGFMANDEAARAAWSTAARAHALSEHSIEAEARRINAVYEAVWREASTPRRQ